MLKNLLKPKSKAEITALEERAAILRAELNEVTENKAASVAALEELQAREQAARRQAQALRQEAGLAVWAARLPDLHGPEEAMAEWARRLDEAILALVPLVQEGLQHRRALAEVHRALGEVRQEWGLDTEVPPASVPAGLEVAAWMPDGNPILSGGLPDLVASRVRRLRLDGRWPGGGAL
ncbi:MAG: hypothetical protein AMXMBFR33_41330 [Candidatus Xenobia bacterium]